MEERQIERRVSPFTANALYLLATAGTFLVPRLLGFLPSGLSATMVFEWFILALPAGLLLTRPGGCKDGGWMKPKARDFWLSCACGLCAAPCGACLTTLFGQVLPGTIAENAISFEPFHFTALLIGSAILPALCEEWFFRGALLSAWSGRGTARALWITTGLFALLHGSVLGLPAQLLVGLALGYTALVTRCVWCACGLHLFYNATLLGSSYFSLSVSVPQLVFGACLFAAATAGLLIWLTRGAIGIKREQSPYEETPWEADVLLTAGIITALGRYALDLCARFGG